MRNILIALTLIVVFVAGGVTVNQYLRPATAAQDDESTAVSSDAPVSAEAIESSNEVVKPTQDSKTSHSRKYTLALYLS